MLHTLSVFTSLYLFWLLLSGYFTAFLLSAGAGCALAGVLLARRMDVVDHEGHAIQLGWRAALGYWPWLALQIALAAWDVAWRILHPRLPITPALVRFAPGQRSDLGLVIHANSITLTPGTVSVQVGPGEFLVHALTREGAAGLAGSEMDRRVTALERAP